MTHHDDEHAIYAHLEALTGDLDAFVAVEQTLRWHSQGYEHPLIASMGDGTVFFGFGLSLDTLDPWFVAHVEAGLVEQVGVEMSTFYGHAWAADYVWPQGDAVDHEEACHRAAAMYARDWLEGVRARIANHWVEPLD
jgi:hypothetical protein